MKIIILHPENKEQLDAIRTLAKALDVRCIMTESEVRPYKSDFVKKIQDGREDVQKGRGVKMTIEDLWI